MWILFAVLARAFWAGTNAVDQILARAHKENSSLAGLILQFLCYLPLAAIGCIYLAHQNLHTDFFVFSLGAVLAAMFGIIPYLMTLKYEQAYNVTPYLELTPVLLIFFAYLFKGETLTPVQLTGAIIVITSGFLFSWDFARGHFKLKVFALLSLASLLFAFYQYCMSQAGLRANIWSTISSFYLGESIVGLILFLALENVRKTIVRTFIHTNGRTSLIALSTNVLDICALGFLLLAFRYAPTLGHVAGLSGAQPIFSFALAIPLARFFPKHFSKIIFNREILAKMILVVFIAIGVYLLTRS